MNPTSCLQFDTMVVATDPTRAASTTLRYGQAVARQHKSVLAVAYVIDPVGYAFPGREPGFEAANQAARDEVQGIEKETRRQSIETHSVANSNVIHKCIMQIAPALHADLQAGYAGRDRDGKSRARHGERTHRKGVLCEHRLTGDLHISCPVLCLPSAGSISPLEGFEEVSYTCEGK